MHLAQTFIDLDEELNLTVLALELFHYMPFVPYKATNTKKVYSPACVNEILSLISKILLLQSLIFSSRDKTRARMWFHF
jgi:hypothetical protein